jgi:superfamily II DNA or RNA helicase
MSRSGPPAASPDWKRLAGTPAGPAAETAGRLAGGTAAPVSMGLQFELREQTPRTNERWRGPTARTVTTVHPGHGEFRLGVRPVIQSARGSWVRTNVAWNQLGFHLNRLNLNPEHHRWLSQLLALHRAVRGVYTSQEADWLYLDHFTSPLLWNLFEEASRIGLRLVGNKKNAGVTVGRTATLGLDASTDGVDTGLRLATRLRIDGETFRAENAGNIGSHGVYAWALGARPRVTLAPTDEPLSAEQLRLLGQPGAVDVPESDLAEFLTEYYPALRHVVPVTSTDASVRFPAADPPVLVLTARFRPKQVLELEWHWDHREGSSVTRSPLRNAPRSPGTDTGADPDPEATILTAAEQALGHDGQPHPGPAPRVLHGIDSAVFAGRTLPRLRKVPGVRVDIVGDQPDYHELTAVPELTVTTIESAQRDWFDLGVLVTVDGRSVPFGPLFTALARGKTRLLLVDNSYLSLRQPVFERLHELIVEARALQEWDIGLRISRHQAALWSEFEDLADETVQAVTWRATVSGLLALTTTGALAEPGSVSLPAGLEATLRPYQLHGFAWLAFLWEHRLGGILADEMGLGKTLQALALLAHASAQPREPDRRPFLVVAPTSVVSNWLSEAARFTPGLSVRAITATEAAGGASIADAAAAVDVVVTSYALFRLDFEAYQAAGWAGLILDEAQFVKNRAAKVHLCARELDTPFKLALTGTPMENNLLELWALFAIVAPGLFPSARRFAEDYLRPVEAGSNPALLARLRRRIRPLMLRRTKDVVATELPPKQEQTLRIELNPRHRRLYDTVLQRERQKLFGLIEDLDQNRFIVFRSLTLLRMLSLDPSLVDEKYAGVRSSKLDALFEQLEDVVAEGHRALVFSQFTSFLGKAAARLDAAGIAYCYLDGSTRHRSAVIDRFKRGTAPVFLISLKAGGFGLNLTEADYVFLLDPWWNPATETQAVDRTHRIGQTKNVMVYRMVATDTIEQKVMALKEQKAALTGSVLDGSGLAGDGGFSDALTADDIRALLEP